MKRENTFQPGIFALLSIVLPFIFAACSTSQPSTLTSADTEPELPVLASPTLISPSPTVLEPTQPPGVISGFLFLDANGSGLFDETIFLCPGSPRYIPESLEVFFPGACDGKGGQFIKVREPVLPGFTVKVAAGISTYEVVTDQNGAFHITTAEPARTPAHLSFVDPNADPLKMSFISLWNQKVHLPAYRVGEYEVPEQELNDTSLIKIDEGLDIFVGEDRAIGFVQGPLTMPVTTTQYPTLTQNQGFDHDLAKGKVADYTGNTHACVSYDLCAEQAEWAPWQGTGDQHSGYDLGWVVEPKGDMAIASMPGEVFTVHEGIELNIVSQLGGNFCDWDQPPDYYGAHYGHNLAALVPEGRVHRGQLVIVIGNTGGTALDSAHIHYDARWGPQVAGLLDMNGDQQCSRPMHRQMDPDYLIPGWNDKSLLTVDNLPQFYE